MGSALLASMVLYLKLKNIPVVTIINRLVTPLTSPFPISIVHNLFVALTITNHNGACCITKIFIFYERNSCTDSNPIWLFRSPLPLISDLRNSLSNICSAHSYYFSGNRDRRGVPSLSNHSLSLRASRKYGSMNSWLVEIVPTALTLWNVNSKDFSVTSMNHWYMRLRMHPVSPEIFILPHMHNSPPIAVHEEWTNQLKSLYQEVEHSV